MKYELQARTQYERMYTHGVYDSYEEAKLNGNALLIIKRIKGYIIVPTPCKGERLTTIKTNLIK